MDLALARCTDCTKLQDVSPGYLWFWPLSVQAQGDKYRMLIFHFCIYHTCALLFSQLSSLDINFFTLLKKNRNKMIS